LGFAVACASKQSPPAREPEPERVPPPAPELVKTPDRPRFVHVPRAYPNFRFRAARIGYELIDRRSSVREVPAGTAALALPSDGATWDVELPVGFEQVVQERLARVVSGSGPELRLVVEVRKLTASHQGELRQIAVELEFKMQDARGRPLLGATRRGSQDLVGPEYDNTELEDVHRAACTDALDAFLASETNMALVNEVVASH